MNLVDRLAPCSDSILRTRTRYVLTLLFFSVVHPAVFMLLVPRTPFWIAVAVVVAVSSGSVVPIVVTGRRNFLAMHARLGRDPRALEAP